MSKNFIVRILALVLLAQSGARAQSRETPTKWTPELMAEVIDISDVQASPDGSRVAYIPEVKTKGYHSQIFIARADGSKPLQLTHGDQSASTPRWSPDGEWIAFLSSQSGARNIWIVQAGGGEARQVTNMKNGVSSFKWSRIGKDIAFTSPDIPGTEGIPMENPETLIVDQDMVRHHLWVVSLRQQTENKFEVRRLTSGLFTVYLNWDGLYDWSPDGKTIVFTHTFTTAEEGLPKTDISLADVATGEIRPLVHTAAAEIRPAYSPDGRWIAYEASEIPFTWRFDWTIHVIPAKGGESHELPKTFNHDPYLLGWAGDSRQVIVEDRERTLYRLYALPVDGGAVTVLNRNVDGLIPQTAVNAGGRFVAFVKESLEQPPEVYVSTISPFHPIKLTSINSQAPSLPLGHTEIVQWASRDGVPVEGLLTYPVGYKQGIRYPLLVVSHGGPAGTFLQYYLGMFSPSQGPYPIAAFASEGYLTLRANIRGSTGYGTEFRHANFNELGGKDFDDLMSGVDAMVQRGIADPERLGIMGWSYGGFMAATAVTQTTRFKAASVGAGFTDLVSFEGTFLVPSWLPDFYGELWDRPDIYQKRSPVFNARGATTPTLIQHGAHDSTVPVGQARELFNALKRGGDTVRMEIYRNFGHNIEDEYVVALCARNNLAWFNRYVRDASQQASRAPAMTAEK